MIKHNSEEYQRSVIRVALAYAPKIYPCKKCGYAVASGYCCTGCGDSNPTEPLENISK